MNNWNKIFKPIVVLTVICIVITGALALTNSVTAPKIREAAERAQNEALYAMLPEADSFTKLEGDWSNVSAVYQANNGAGTIVTSTGNGKNGAITVMTAFVDGSIKEIKVMEHSEDKGIGDKATDSKEYLGQFSGKEAQALSMGTDIQAVTNATLSSQGILRAVNNGIAAYNETRGVENVVPTVTIDPELLASWQQTGLEILPGASSFTVAEGAWDGVNVVLKADNGGYVISATGSGMMGEMTVLTAISNGSIVGVRVVDCNAAEGVAPSATLQLDDFCGQFAGKAAQTLDYASQIDGVTGATITGDGITTIVNSAIAAYNDIA